MLFTNVSLFLHLRSSIYFKVEKTAFFLPFLFLFRLLSPFVPSRSMIYTFGLQTTNFISNPFARGLPYLGKAKAEEQSSAFLSDEFAFGKRYDRIARLFSNAPKADVRLRARVADRRGRRSLRLQSASVIFVGEAISLPPCKGIYLYCGGRILSAPTNKTGKRTNS